MTIVFVSNFFNHHQRPLSDALYTLTGGHYAFISAGSVSEERKKLGYQDDGFPDYVISLRSPLARKLIDEADVVIFGSAPESVLARRIREGKLIFRYSERPLKHGPEHLKYLPRLFRWHRRNPPGKPIYLLCASAYTAGDYARFGLFLRRRYRWGYFPEMNRYASPEALINGKDPTAIVWAGRFLDWKHPDDAIRTAARLKQENIPFTMTLIGCGAMEDKLHALVREYDLSDRVFLPGAMKPEEVRSHMERAGIYLLTSDHREGWGAVANEAMGCGCALVGCRAAGSVPYLVEDGRNGLSYPAGDTQALYRHVKALLQSPARQQELGRSAYHTIHGLWNASTAAERLVRLAEAILSGQTNPRLYTEGPCSPDNG